MTRVSLRRRIGCLLAAPVVVAVYATTSAPAAQKAETEAVDLFRDANVTITGAARNDFAGFSVASAGDVNGDGRPDLIIGAPGTNGNTMPGDRTSSGAAYVVFGQATAKSLSLGALGSRGFRIDGAAGDGVGQSVGGGGDVNGDGLSDVIVSTQGRETKPGAYSSAVYVVFGSRSAETVDLAEPNPRGFRIDGEESTSEGASRVADAGDVNADGRADVIVGGAALNSAYVVFGKGSTEPVDLSELGLGGYPIRGARTGDATGFGVGAAGDVNGDGRADVLVGASGADPKGHESAGSAYVVFGQEANEAVELGQLGSRGRRIDGAHTGDKAGQSLAGAGDFNDDGFSDVVVGASESSPAKRNRAGAAYVVFGSPSTSTVDLARLGRRGVRVIGGAANDFTGFSVAGTGDVNGDGRSDVILGAPFASSRAELAGSAYVVFGSDATTIDLASLGSRGFRLDGREYEGAGWAVAAAGDVNADGRADVAVGARDSTLRFSRAPARNGLDPPRARNGSEPTRVVFGFALGRCVNRQRGTRGPDELTGTIYGDAIAGLGGSDTLRGRRGDDCMVGGAGGDRLEGGEDNDRLVGGSGADVFSAGAGRDRLDARDGLRDLLRCGPGRDVVHADRSDRVAADCERVIRMPRR